MNSRPVIIFFKLNPLNLPFALFAKVFFRVIYLRSQWIPGSLLKRFEVFDIVQFYTFDEWQRLSDSNYKYWKETADNWSREDMHYRLMGVRVDFMTCWLQWLAIDHEEHCQFLDLVGRWARAQKEMPRYYIAGTILFSGLKSKHLKFPPFPCPVLKIFALLDRLWFWLFSILVACRQIMVLCLKLWHKRNRLNETYRYLWANVSGSEMADGSGKLDFSFLCRRGLIDPNDCLYFLPKSPSSTCINHMAEKNVHWLVEKEWHTLLALKSRAFLALAIFATVMKSLVSHRNRFTLPIVLLMMIRAQTWIPIIKRLKPEIYISSMSASWPEHPAVAAMNAMGVRTINWFYSANTFKWVSDHSSFEDRNAVLSIFVTQEIWVWDKLFQDWLCHRLVLDRERHPAIRVIGPIMCGNSRLVKKNSHDVRLEWGIKESSEIKYIAVFDVAPMSKKRQLLRGNVHPPFTTEVQQSFFEHISEILDSFPNVKLIIKLKRSLDASGKTYAGSLKRLADPASNWVQKGKVILLDHDTDPYLPIAMADLCLGVPFTSPVLAALHLGRLGIYHDPLGRVRSFYPRILEPIITHSSKELFEIVRKLVEDDLEFPGNDAAYRKITDTVMKTNELYDPVIEFARCLQNPNPGE